MLDQPHIILCQPSHPGNIGATARAMKTMGLTHLSLVQPKKFPDPEATVRATHAMDILENCKIYDNLEDAIKDYGFVLGTTARKRTLQWPIYHPKTAVLEMNNQIKQQNQVAILFGNERTGLENSQLQKCHGLIHIPTNSECSALNLAATVQIIAYEFAQNKPEDTIQSCKYETNATQQQLTFFYQHFESILGSIDFFTAHNPEHIMGKLQCLINRSIPKKSEIALLRGILSQLAYRLNNRYEEE